MMRLTEKKPITKKTVTFSLSIETVKKFDELAKKLREKGIKTNKSYIVQQAFDNAIEVMKKELS